MPRAVPIAGAIIGCIGGATVLVSDLLGFGAVVASVICLATLTLVTGAFHEDGLADTADGFGGGSTPERRLEIMKDSRIGSYGGAALILAYALRIACLAELIARIGALSGAGVVVFTASLSRTAALIVMARLPPARMIGSSYAAGQPPARAVLIAFATCAVLAIVIGVAAPLPGLGVAYGFVFAVGIALLMTRLSARLIGGQTGDVGGATQQLAEIAALLGLLIGAEP